MMSKAGGKVPQQNILSQLAEFTTNFHKLPCESIAFFGHDRPRHSNAQTKNS